MAQWRDSDPTINPWTSSRASETSPERTSRSVGLRTSVNANLEDAQRQQSLSPTEYNTNSNDYFYNNFNARGPQRSATTPNLAQHKAVNRIRFESDGQIISNQRRQSTHDTKYSATFEETLPWDRKAILSLDGGGIRGYSALLIIRELMRVIKIREKNHELGAADSSYHPSPWNPVYATDTRSSGQSDEDIQSTNESSQWLPCHYFDYMAGTSTGGLISIMLGRLRMSIDDCISDYEKLGGKVFGHSRWFHVRSPLWWPRDKYNHEKLENVVKEVVARRVPKIPKFPGGQNFAFDENRCRAVVVSYQQQNNEDRKRNVMERPYLFRTYKNLHQSDEVKEQWRDRNPGPAHDIPIWQVARATSAAPGYFKPSEIDNLKYVDGGFGANNPSSEIFEEVLIMNNQTQTCIRVFVSIGTGKNKGVARLPVLREGSRRARLYDMVNVVRDSGLFRFIKLANVAAKWASQSEETHEDVAKESRRAKVQYFRLNVEDGIGPMKLDEWRVRGPIRRGVGSSIGGLRRAFSAKPKEQTQRQNGNAVTGEKTASSTINEAAQSQGQNGEAAAVERATSKPPSTATQTHHSAIPKWFRPKNKTLDSLRKYTSEYLRRPDVQALIEEIADILVEQRRARAFSDRDRWEKACFGAWYQCNVPGCHRGEKEYHDRHSLEKHLLHKHGDMFTQQDQVELDKLEKALDDCKIVVH